MKAYGGEVELQSLLTLAMDEGKWLASRPFRFIRGKIPRYTMNKWKTSGPQSRYGPFGQDRNILSLSQIKPQIAQLI